jgi:hypothetical protein
MKTRPQPRPIKLPTEEQIRNRLSHLATEANSLRRLLRLVRKNSPKETQVREAHVHVTR